MKLHDEDYYLSWLDDNKSELRREYCNLNEDNFADYRKEEFNRWCNDND